MHIAADDNAYSHNAMSLCLAVLGVMVVTTTATLPMEEAVTVAT